MSIIELQIINVILETKSLAMLINNGIDSSFFIGYQDEYKFIEKHYQKYGKVPDKLTFLDKFEEFEILQVEESEHYLIETFKENHLFYKIAPFVKELATKAEENSLEAVEFLRKKVNEFSDILMVGNSGYDLVKNSMERNTEYEFRLETEGLLGISTGIEELDHITHGWLKNDFVPITGRTNEGKSWVLLFFLTAAWNAGKKVLLYSGEMNHTIVGFRFDTLNAHFKNLGLMQGEADLGNGKEAKDYKKYLERLDDMDVPFIVITPKDLGGKRLDIPALHQLIEKYKPDIVGVDQLSLMEDYRRERGEQNRIKFTHIAEDLYLTSEKYEIPILAPAQSNRDAQKNKNDDAPELVHIAESDGVAQNATRVISIKAIDETLKISLKKNRYGINNRELMIIADWDNGLIKPFSFVENDERGGAVNVTPIGNPEELF